MAYRWVLKRLSFLFQSLLTFKLETKIENYFTERSAYAETGNTYLKRQLLNSLQKPVISILSITVESFNHK